MSDKYQTTGYLRNGCGLIAEERVRQEQTLNWTPEHDDKHIEGELRDAAIAYAMVCDDRAGECAPDCFPWDVKMYWKPGSVPRNLVKAGALIAAELDRLWRRFQAECNQIAESDLGFTVFDELDAYELEQYDWIDTDPESFLKEHFAEDYARLQIEHEQAQQAEEEAEGEEAPE